MTHYTAKLSQNSHVIVNGFWFSWHRQLTIIIISSMSGNKVHNDHKWASATLSQRSIVCDNPLLNSTTRWNRALAIATRCLCIQMYDCSREPLREHRAHADYFESESKPNAQQQTVQQNSFTHDRVHTSHCRYPLCVTHPLARSFVRSSVARVRQFSPPRSLSPAVLVVRNVNKQTNPTNS